MLVGVTVEYQQERKGFWHEPDGTPTSETLALEAWVHEAYDVLAETATGYHATLGAERFAELLQERTSIRTTRPHARWLHKVLQPIETVCERTGDPPLTSLVIEGTDDLDAARRRLACYRWAGSAPADGGVPAPLTPARRTRASTPRQPRSPAAPRAPREPKAAAPKRVAASDRPVTVCPTCFMAVPATGICDNCG